MVKKLGLMLFCMIFAVILLIPTVSSAKIEGTIYDIELNQLTGVKVELNSVPKQVFVSTDGLYSFIAPEGRYSITASYVKDDLKIRETVVIRDDGVYTLDLILLPDLGIEEEILDEASNIDVSDSYFDSNADTTSRLIAAGAVILAGFAGFFVYHKLKGKKKSVVKKTKSKKKTSSSKTVKKLVKNIPKVIVDNSDEEQKVAKPLSSGSDLKDLMDFIRKEEGRTTQKDIRRQFPLSEAKISLMIAELEDKGLIKKIKKGRGNIIVLN